jgi:hypothetical protein
MGGVSSPVAGLTGVCRCAWIQGGLERTSAPSRYVLQTLTFQPSVAHTILNGNDQLDLNFSWP